MRNNFDANLFREMYPVYEFEVDQACHALWVKYHRFDLSVCTEEHLLSYIGFQLVAYPRGFPWEVYARLYPEAARNRWTALEHFVHHGFDHIGVSLSYQEGAGTFLFAVGQYYANRDDRLAIRALELSLGEPDAPPDVRKWLADAYLRHQVWHRSRAVYAELIDELVVRRDVSRGDGASGNPACTTSMHKAQAGYVADIVRGFVESSNRLDRWERFFDRLSALLEIDDSSHELQLEICSAYFDRRAGAARQFYFAGAKPPADEIMAATVDDVSRFMSLRSVAKPRSKTISGAQVLILLETLEDEQKKERLEQHRRALKELRIDTRVFKVEEIGAFEEALASAQAAIFLSVAAWPHVIAAIGAARAAGVATFYEIDDLVMDPGHSPPPLAHFDSLMGRDAYTDLLFGAAMYRGAASLCDYGITPNDALAARLAPLIRTKRCFAIKDCAMSCSTAGNHVPELGSFSFFLRSLPARIFDRRDPAAVALLELLQSRDDFKVFVSGYLQLGKAFDQFRTRFTRVDVNGEYRRVLATCHANIALDEGGERGACLPERSWLEAAQLGVPTIASSTKAYGERLIEGFDVILVQTASEWRKAMETFIDNPTDRASIAAAARSRALSSYSLAEALPSYRTAFEFVSA